VFRRHTSSKRDRLRQGLDSRPRKLDQSQDRDRGNFRRHWSRQCLNASIVQPNAAPNPRPWRETPFLPRDFRKAVETRKAQSLLSGLLEVLTFSYTGSSIARRLAKSTLPTCAERKKKKKRRTKLTWDRDLKGSVFAFWVVDRISRRVGACLCVHSALCATGVYHPALLGFSELLFKLGYRHEAGVPHEATSRGRGVTRRMRCTRRDEVAVFRQALANATSRHRRGASTRVRQYTRRWSTSTNTSSTTASSSVLFRSGKWSFVDADSNVM
jgi:hypothetical protein